MPRILLSVLALVLLNAAPGFAGEMLVLRLDPEQTTVRLRFGATLHTVHGTLGPASGRIAFDPATGLASGEVVIDLTQAETGNHRRDRKMHEKILETETHPRAVYRVERIDLPGALQPGVNNLQLHGTMEFHGMSHPVSLPAVATLVGDRVEATAWLDVPYVDWGLDDPSFFVLRVSKTVRVEIEAVGLIEGDLAGAGIPASSEPR